MLVKDMNKECLGEYERIYTTEIDEDFLVVTKIAITYSRDTDDIVLTSIDTLNDGFLVQRKIEENERSIVKSRLFPIPSVYAYFDIFKTKSPYKFSDAEGNIFVNADAEVLDAFQELFPMTIENVFFGKINERSNFYTFLNDEELRKEHYVDFSGKISMIRRTQNLVVIKFKLKANECIKEIVFKLIQYVLEDLLDAILP